MQEELINKVQELRMILTRLATGQEGKGDFDLYIQLRTELFLSKVTRSLIPDFITSCRVLDDFWPYIKTRYSTYAERGEFIRVQFEPLFAYLEGDKIFLYHDVISDSITKFDCDTVLYMWEKALERRTADPDGAITAARSLIESVCKQILTERDIDYEDSYDLPKLFKTTAKCLNLAPELHNDGIIKQILSGIQTTVHGFSALRNELSDAHGQPKGGYRANSRHAEFAVNLAGSTASFLIKTHQETLQTERKSSVPRMLVVR